MLCIQKGGIYRKMAILTFKDSIQFREPMWNLLKLNRLNIWRDLNGQTKLKSLRKKIKHHFRRNFCIIALKISANVWFQYIIFTVFCWNLHLHFSAEKNPLISVLISSSVNLAKRSILINTILQKFANKPPR